MDNSIDVSFKIITDNFNDFIELFFQVNENEFVLKKIDNSFCGIINLLFNVESKKEYLECLEKIEKKLDYIKISKVVDSYNLILYENIYKFINNKIIDIFKQIGFETYLEMNSKKNPNESYFYFENSQMIEEILDETIHLIPKYKDTLNKYILLEFQSINFDFYKFLSLNDATMLDDDKMIIDLMKVKKILDKAATFDLDDFIEDYHKKFVSIMLETIYVIFIYYSPNHILEISFDDYIYDLKNDIKSNIKNTISCAKANLSTSNYGIEVAELASLNLSKIIVDYKIKDLKVPFIK